MDIINTGRRSGKTVELIKRCDNNGGYIVCNNKKEADRICRIAIELGYNIPYPLTYAEVFAKNYYGKGVKKLHIDNADEMLKMLVNDVELATITINE